MYTKIQHHWHQPAQQGEREGQSNKQIRHFKPPGTKPWKHIPKHEYWQHKRNSYGAQNFSLNTEKQEVFAQKTPEPLLNERNEENEDMANGRSNTYRETVTVKPTTEFISKIKKHEYLTSPMDTDHLFTTTKRFDYQTVAITLLRELAAHSKCNTRAIIKDLPEVMMRHASGWIPCK